MNKSTDRYLSWYVRKLLTQSQPKVKLWYTSGIHPNKVTIMMHTGSTSRKGVRVKGTRRLEISAAPTLLIAHADPRFIFPSFFEVKEALLSLGFSMHGGKIKKKHIVELRLKNEPTGLITLA
mgnify:FL=1